MKISFTGTRRGMTPAQYERVYFAVRHFHIERGFHGAAIGADRQFHEICHALVPLELYPSNEEQHRWSFATCEGGWHIVHPITHDPLARNRVMIDRADLTIAAPSSRVEAKRGSGTWQGIRYARKMGKPLVICWPDGKVREENATNGETLQV